MIEDTLEEDLPAEFRGGTLQINTDNKINDTLSTESTSDKHDNSTNLIKSNDDWRNSLKTPLNKLTETFMKTDCKSTNNDSAMQPTIHIDENPNNFFTFRESVVEKALTECIEQFLNEQTDGPLISAFLLTQITSWNVDKERLILLTSTCLLVVKYDFIALKRLAYKKIALDLLDEVWIGDLIYPNSSLIPRMNGLVDGISNVLETCLFLKWSSNDDDKHLGNFYRPRNRNMRGIRLVWDKNKSSKFTTQWNPFNDDLFLTLTYHPLYFHKECTDEKMKKLYDLEAFIETLTLAIAELQRTKQKDNCLIHHKDILLQNYLGLGSVIHNRNALGFFKVRGKFSF